MDKMLDQLEAEFPEHSPRPSNAPKALEGIRVVDFSHFIAGPLATMILADMAKLGILPLSAKMEVQKVYCLRH